MKKVVLIDGNNLIFRSYYATAYTGNTMKTSKGFPTNALYGFVSMINKIISEENPEYMAVAFDKGKNFRTEKYKDYKAGRIAMPDDLRVQFDIAKDIIKAMGIKYYEIEPYEADDIIGTFARLADEDPQFDATIISSDKDLLQLISDQVDVKLLKQKDYIRYNPNSFKEDYGIEPIRIIDLKALAGDSSDNIPGVKGVGDKTALTLLQKYGSLEGIYENIDEISGKLQEKLINDKENAFFSKELATIYKSVPLNIDLIDTKMEDIDEDGLNKIYDELEFYSLIKKSNREVKNIDTDYIEITDINDLKVEEDCSFYIECDDINYHDGNIIGMSITDKNNTYYIDSDLVMKAFEKIADSSKSTYDLKKAIVLLKRFDKTIENVNFDAMIAAYLLNISFREDIAYLMNPKGYEVEFYDVMKKDKFQYIDKVKSDIALKSKFIYETKEDYIEKLKLEEMYDLFINIEIPLIKVLADMEYTGIKVDADILKAMAEETKIKIEFILKDIYNHAGMEFNVASPKQLGDVLFNRLGLPGGTKTKGGNYKTDAKKLHKLIGVHPIIDKIIEFRNLNKLYTTYLESLVNYIHSDNKIHTIYKQNLTRTGRLSSVEPNMQNIPTKDEEGRKIKKAFLPSSNEHELLCADYSQIELRILAHISNSKELIDAFNSDADIHTKVASDVFGVEEIAVTKKMRSTAKAVIFGIVYGISGFGLGENLEIGMKEASNFISKYYELYPDVKKYMDNCIKDAYTLGYVRTLFNRKRYIEELKNTNYMIRQGGERIALNTPIQGTSADIIKKAMVEIYEKFESDNIQSKMLLQVHDELIFDVLKSEKDRVLEIVKNCMENTIKLKVPIKVSADFGSNWYEAK